MLDHNTTENVFRFQQLRPARPVDPYPELALAADTEFVRRLSETPPVSRGAIAGEYLAATGQQTLDNPLASGILDHIDALGTRGTVRQLQSRLQGYDAAQGRTLRRALSDALLAAKFSGGAAGRRANTIDRLFRTISLVGAPPFEPEETSLAEFFRRPLALLPALAFAPRKHAQSKPATPPPAGSTQLPPPTPDLSAWQHAADELFRLARPELLNLPDEGDARQPAGQGTRYTVFSLSERGATQLSERTRRVLDTLGIDIRAEALDAVIDSLEGAIAAGASAVGDRSRALTTEYDDEPEPLPYIRDTGVADLLVVKQHLRKYDRADVAHVENVLTGEKRSRTHRALERTEETTLIERETVEERETELETAERFELNKETARTVQRDQQFGFGLTLSGKYGPSVEFSSTLQADVGSSSEEVARSATTYAKDIVERSLERVVERVREEHVRKVLREQEETNVHELENAGAEHTSGVYQFLEKVYESQVFNYGIRQIFDFMVPEPASYLWYLEGSETELNLPTPPPRLDLEVPSAAAVNESNYLRFAARFGADGIEAPPRRFLKVTASLSHGEGEDEEGQPRSVSEKEVAVPEKYRPYRALVRPLALTDDQLTLAITVGSARRVWKPNAAERTPVGSDHTIGSAQLDLNLISNSQPFDPQSKLVVHVLAFETNTYAVAAEVLLQRTPESFTEWQIKVYDKLVAAHRESILKYEQKVAELQAQAEAEAARAVTRFGAPPSQNLKIIKGELKKHCTSIITRQRYDAFDATRDADPPYFNFVEAQTEGSYIRFFEQAFEWDQMQFVFYPYYWGRKSTWAARFLRQDVDPTLLEFLQAGSARVVVPTRPGFEIAVAHFLETGEIWNGEGEPPVITSPLYLPIVTEIQERTGGPQGEIPVGDPWPTRVPTPLVMLRKDDTLPEWQRLDPDGWDWEEVPAGDRTSE